MNLKKSLIVVQELVFQSTIRGKSNWIRFPVNSRFHTMIGHGRVDGVSLKDIIIHDGICEIKT